MEKIVYVAFAVDAKSYEEAETKVKDSFQTVDGILADTILLDSKETTIRKIIGSHKVVNHTKI